MIFGLHVMHIFRRIWFPVLVFLLITPKANSQLIEKAPPSPVAVNGSIPDSIGSSVEVSNILLTGFKRTKSYIIQREIPFKKGDIVATSELEAKLSLCKQRLMNTALFVDVHVNAVRKDSNNITVAINVKERWYFFPIPYFKIVSRNLNTWWVEERRRLDRVEYGLKFMQNNVSGRNDNLNLWFVSGYTQQISLRYDNPNIDNKLKNGINIGVGYKRSRELNYGMDLLLPNKLGFFKQEDQFIFSQWHTDLSYIYRPAIKTRHIFRTSFSHFSVKDTVVKLNPDYLPSRTQRAIIGDIGYTLQYTNLDYNPYPLKGIATEVSLYKRFGRNANMWQLSGRLNHAVKIAPASFLQLQAVGTLRLPFHQPYISNNLMGSADFYMRGLEYYVVQGAAGGIARATLKNNVLSLNVRNPINSKTHDKIPVRIFLKTYGDLGYSYTPNTGISRLNNKMLRTFGFGLDIVTFYDIVVKLEYSFNQLGESGLFIHTQTDF